ncbi:cyclic pyranopterin monophosphate synthase MoaC [Acinetobacter gerneri]|uniref:cyclic pyranopterin monophosphate synthase MoaC n=1 Tax=Acinetobacter gerneri TaxID=202952 RepID=UPI002936444F|nr:cyclic pyranopterin monophosphate synthase MoaC [Acinetobacter gerneri]MDV2439088.1 cyclic pyranopterin monophosphate synthase MoaC [Acinetobacter gerneri]
MNPSLTHFNQHGQAHMVDVSQKNITKRVAKAQGKIFVSPVAFACVEKGHSKKGDILAVARIAAIQASKQTSGLIPLCHPIALTHVNVDFELDPIMNSIRIMVTTETIAQTGVEMEALCAVNVGLLTIYDMLKAVDKSMKMTDIYLLEKLGGQSGNWVYQ